MNAKSTKLYFVALVPPEDVLQKAQNLKEEVAEQCGSKAALRSPPHITLHMPFKFREEREGKIEKVLTDFCESQEPFEIRQEGFGAFPPRVIYVNVEKTPPLEMMRGSLVRAMRLKLKLENADYKDKPFHPHMTIAFRDLKKRIFPEAWAYYQKQSFSETWECSDLVLLKHNGKIWNIFKRFPFAEGQ